MKHSYDEEAYEVLLADDELWEEFYSRLSEFGKTLGIALSSEKFLTETDETTLSRYKADLRKFVYIEHGRSNTNATIGGLRRVKEAADGKLIDEIRRRIPLELSRESGE